MTASPARSAIAPTIASMWPTGFPPRSRSAAMRPYSSPAGPSRGKMSTPPGTARPRSRRSWPRTRVGPRGAPACAARRDGLGSGRRGSPCRGRPLELHLAGPDSAALTVHALDRRRQVLVGAEGMKDFQQAPGVVPPREADDGIRERLLALLHALLLAVRLLRPGDGLVWHHMCDVFHTLKGIGPLLFVSFRARRSFPIPGESRSPLGGQERARDHQQSTAKLDDRRRGVGRQDRERNRNPEERARRDDRTRAHRTDLLERDVEEPYHARDSDEAEGCPKEEVLHVEGV